MAGFREAAALAAQGLKVFRIAKGEKAVFVDADWNKGGATSDMLALFSKFPEGCDYNIGILASELVIVDVDVKNGAQGASSLAALQAEIGPLPPTLVVGTPSGGRHYVYRAPAGVSFAGGTNRLGLGIDVRAAGGYAVAPGSWTRERVEGGKVRQAEGFYRVAHDAPVAPLPATLASKMREARVRELATVRAVGEIDAPQAIAAAKAFLTARAPAVEGASGDEWTYKTACKVLELGLSPETALEVMAQWDEKNCPPWGEELERKIASAAQYMQNAAGSRNPVAGFELSADALAIAQAAAAREPAPEAPAAPRAPDDLRKLLKYARDASLDAIIARRRGALVAGLLHPGEVAVMYGDSTAGKSFAALDLAWHIAHGARWHGRRTTRAPVLYCAFEGFGGFEARKIALRDAHPLGDPGDWFAQLDLEAPETRGLSLARSQDEERREVALSLLTGAFGVLSEDAGATSPGLIIIDTLGQATAGDDENDTAMMTFFCRHIAQEIAHRTGAAVMIVHHTNKQGVVRGNAALKGAADVMLRVDRNAYAYSVGRDQRRVLAEKVKDGKEGLLFNFALRDVPTIYAGDDLCEAFSAPIVVLDPSEWAEEPKESKTASKQSPASAGFPKLSGRASIN